MYSTLVYVSLPGVPADAGIVAYPMDAECTRRVYAGNVFVNHYVRNLSSI